MLKKFITVLFLISLLPSCATNESSQEPNTVNVGNKVFLLEENWEPTKKWHFNMLEEGVPSFQVEAFEKGYYTFRWKSKEWNYTREDYIRDFGEEPTSDLGL